MKKYLLRRILSMVPVLLGVSALVFLMLHLIPGDPARAMLGEHASPQAVLALRAKLGLNEPIGVQFVRFLKGVITLNFGRSIQTDNPAFTEVLLRYPATIELAVSAMMIAACAGMAFGMLSAAYKGTFIDHAGTFISLLGLSIPIFWLGLIFILMFAVDVRWFPFSGRIFVATIFKPRTHFYILDSLLTGNLQVVRDVFGHLFLPALTLSTIPLAMIARTARASLLEVLHEDYMRTALCKGLSPWQALWRHGMKNALIPVVTVTGLQFGYLLGGAILTETVFGWPGIGSLVVDAVKARDYPVVQASVFAIAATFVLVNSAVDLAYAYIDPRIRHS